MVAALSPKFPLVAILLLCCFLSALTACEVERRRSDSELGLNPHEPIHVEPYLGALHRHLHVLVKVGPTPARFPRRPGMARKRPLGVSSDRTSR